MDEYQHLSLQIRDVPDTRAAAQLCAHSMQDNPIHQRVFGSDPAQRQRRLTGFFSILIPVIHRRGLLIGTYADDTLIGVLGMLPPGACRSVRPELLRRLSPLLLGNSAIGVLRQCRWLGTWAWYDPREPHWHVGPLAVTPAQQGRGVGSHLMAQGIARMGGRHAFMYLETDKSINVSFYEKFGFRVTSVRPVLGTPSWLLWRDSAASTDPARLNGLV